MSVKVITKQEYLEELAEAAAKRIALASTPQTIEIMTKTWKEIIIQEMKPILEVIH